MKGGGEGGQRISTRNSLGTMVPGVGWGGGGENTNVNVS